MFFKNTKKFNYLSKKLPEPKLLRDAECKRDLGEEPLRGAVGKAHESFTHDMGVDSQPHNAEHAGAEELPQNHEVQGPLPVNRSVLDVQHSRVEKVAEVEQGVLFVQREARVDKSRKIR